MADIYYCNRGTKADTATAGIKAYNEYQRSSQIFRDSNMSYLDFLDCWIKEYCIINLKSTTIEGYQKKNTTLYKAVFGNVSTYCSHSCCSTNFYERSIA